VAAMTRTLILRVRISPTALDLLLLQDPQDLRLHRRRKFADFVQKESPRRRPFRSGPACPGERQ